MRAKPAIYRLLVCAGASIALHALTLSANGVELKSTRYTVPNATVLHAALMPVESTSVPTDSTINDAYHVEHPDLSRQVTTQYASTWNQPEDLATVDNAEDPIAGPAPDKWYTAEEVDVRAEPLASLKLGYPERLAGSRITGRVRIALFIDEEGWVRNAEVVASQPERLFDEIAVSAWQNVRFLPALMSRQAVKSKKLLEIEFHPD
jgi:TonB family protein